MGQAVGGSLKREGTRVYRGLTQVDAWQKPTQHCKAIILQLKKNNKKIKLKTKKPCSGNFSKQQEIVVDRGVWHAEIHCVSKSRTKLVTEQE